MASYLAIDSRVAVSQVSAVLDFAFTNGFFSPVALGGVAVRRGTYQWFLAGYALNRFVERYVRGSKQTSNITTSAHCPDAERHVAAISSSIQAWRLRGGTASPFERSVPNVDVTFIPERLLSVDTVAEVASWMRELPGATLHMVGCLDLLGMPEHLPWDRSFRQLRTAESGVPLIELLVRSARDAGPQPWHIQVFSSAEFWRSATEHYGTPESLENLARLTAFVRSVIGFGFDAEMTVEGSYQQAKDLLSGLLISK